MKYKNIVYSEKSSLNILTLIASQLISTSIVEEATSLGAAFQKIDFGEVKSQIHMFNSEYSTGTHLA